MLQALQTGGTYVNVHTALNGPGEIRGQIAVTASVSTAVAAHVHIGAAGRAGPVAIPLCGPCRSGVRKSVQLQGSVLTALEAGRAYVNIHTARSPAGEIRGQIRAVPLSIS